MKETYVEGLDKRDAFKKIQIIESKGTKEVFVKGKLYMKWKVEDQIAQRVAIAQLYRCGIGTREELAETFGVDIKSVYNYSRAFTLGGIQNLVGQGSGPKQSWKLLPEVRAKILIIVLEEGIREYASIQKRLKDGWNTELSIASIRDVLIENGLVKGSITGGKTQTNPADLFKDESKGQLSFDLEFSNNKEEDTDISITKSAKRDEDQNNIDLSNKNRSSFSRPQRIYLDQLEQGIYNTYAGGLLFVPLLMQYNYLPIIKKTINIETYAGYNLDELCLTLFYFDLFRFESMENFKTVYPEEMGQLIGSISSPSIYTLRRFLHKVKELSKGEELIDEFAKEYLKRGITKWGVLYIDGKFLPYSGIYCIQMGFHGVRKIPMKGSYNFLAIDERFIPLLFLVRSSSEDLLQKIPELILKAKKLAKEVGISEEDINNLIAVFDREGYSAELFRILDGKGSGNEKFKAKFITWGKYADKWVYDIEDVKFDKTVTVTYLSAARQVR